MKSGGVRRIALDTTMKSDMPPDFRICYRTPGKLMYVNGVPWVRIPPRRLRDNNLENVKGRPVERPFSVVVPFFVSRPRTRGLAPSPNLESYLMRQFAHVLFGALGAAAVLGYLVFGGAAWQMLDPDGDSGASSGRLPLWGHSEAPRLRGTRLAVSKAPDLVRTDCARVLDRIWPNQLNHH